MGLYITYLYVALLQHLGRNSLEQVESVSPPVSGPEVGRLGAVLVLISPSDLHGLICFPFSPVCIFRIFFAIKHGKTRSDQFSV